MLQIKTKTMANGNPSANVKTNGKLIDLLFEMAGAMAVFLQTISEGDPQKAKEFLTMLGKITEMAIDTGDFREEEEGATT